MRDQRPERTFGDRRSIRLPKYDYASRGMYFVTICARNMECVFGSVGTEGQITLSEWGHGVEACWRAIPEHFPNVALDTSITMPNHLHGILRVREPGSKGHALVTCQGEAYLDPTNVSGAHGPGRRSLGAIVGSFKSAVTKQIREMDATPDEVVWQRDYYDHIIRDKDDLQRIRKYIETNPIRWAMKCNRQGDACVAPTNVASRTNTPARRRE